MSNIKKSLKLIIDTQTGLKEMISPKECHGFKTYANRLGFFELRYTKLPSTWHLRKSNTNREQDFISK